MDKITLSIDSLMSQAPTTISTYLDAAVKVLNRKFNDENYAKTHPELVGAYITSCSIDFATGILAQNIQELVEVASDINNSLCELVEKDTVSLK